MPVHQRHVDAALLAVDLVVGAGAAQVGECASTPQWMPENRSHCFTK